MTAFDYKATNPKHTYEIEHALLLHKVYNSVTQDQEGFDIFFNQNFNERTKMVNFLIQANSNKVKTSFATDLCASKIK